ncbi:6-bladed beta-propeller [Alkaliflexus imshenetskii]|uniref:6-bladed beta-propeller n=1 Tax=Alkaliflexus imshenetskii TaxID=286730 RepID=UPI00047B9D8F|nr:6-bladed beta-propeller [Alkaliflexus imshenetskii]
MKLNFSPCVFFVVIQTVLLFIGCNSNNSRNNKSYFDITKIKVFENVLESVLSSEIIDDVEYITLESDSNSIIGKIDKFLLTDSYIYVMDAEQSKRIFQFDSNGSFIRVIGNYGKGPGEYQKLVDFTICELTNRIFVLDINRKLIIYDLHGDLLSEMRINQGDPLSSRILSYNNELYLYTGRGGNYSSVYSLVQLDSEGNQNIGYLKFENYPNHSISIASPIYVINGNLKMFDLFEGVLLTMEQDQFKEEFLFDFTNRTIPVDVLCSFDKYINNIHNYSMAGQYFVEGLDKTEHSHPKNGLVEV